MSMATREATNDYVAQELRAELARKRLSMSEVARRLDVEQTWLYKRLTGLIPLRIGEVVDIADVLEMPLDRLFAGMDAIKRKFSHCVADLRIRRLAVAF